MKRSCSNPAEMVNKYETFLEDREKVVDQQNNEDQIDAHKKNTIKVEKELEEI